MDNLCKVIAHLLADDQLVCQVGALIVPRSLMVDENVGNFHAEVTVDGATSNNSGSFRFTRGDTPKIMRFEQNQAVVPSAVSGSWSNWINNDVIDGSQTSESESLDAFIANGGCANPLMVQVRDVSTGAVYNEEDLIQGWNDCACTGGIYTGLVCNVPAEDAGKFTCTADHEIRFYCSDANVLGFATDQGL